MLSSFAHPHFKNDDNNNKFTYIESIKSFKDNAQSNTHSHTKYNLLILMQRQHQYDKSLTSIYQHLCIRCQQFLSYGTPEMHKLMTKVKIAKIAKHTGGGEPCIERQKKSKKAKNLWSACFLSHLFRLATQQTSHYQQFLIWSLINFLAAESWCSVVKYRLAHNKHHLIQNIENLQLKLMISTQHWTK